VAERRTGGPYRSLAELCRRTGLGAKSVEGLILAGAFLFEGRSREEQLWELYGRTERPGRPELPLADEVADLPERTAHEQVLLDHLVLGFSLDRHLVASYRARLRGLRVVTSRELAKLPDGREAHIGGLVVCRQRPATAKGFVFLTVEDEWGLMNVIVRPDVYQTYRPALRDSPLVAIFGKVQKAYGTTNLVAARALAVDPRVVDPTGEREAITAGVRSHDFR
jgi:error-prone DNA polymerase